MVKVNSREVGSEVLKLVFQLRKLRKPLVPEEMSNPAGISDIVILDMEKREFKLLF